MLVWKLVRIHKGKISIESVENKGTRVKVIFPQKQFRSQQVPTETVQQENVVPVSPSAVSPHTYNCLLYTSPSPRDGLLSRMPSSA